MSSISSFLNASFIKEENKAKLILAKNDASVPILIKTQVLSVVN